ncbi:MAG: histidine kinase, partial [Ignavibacteria bacterium]
MLKSKKKYSSVGEDENELTSEKEGNILRPSISIRTRLIVAFLLIFALCATIALWSIFTIAEVMDKIHFLETSDNYKAEIQEARRYEKNFLLYGTNLDDAKIHVKNAERILKDNSETIEKILGQDDFNNMNEHLKDYDQLLTKLGNVIDEEEKKTIESALRDHGAEMVERALDFERIERDSVEEMLALARRIP